jgi:predicted ATPase
MITRIEINGFKSFHDFAVNLRPFQVFIGPNGAGKSNLFDAIVLLSNLAGDNTLYDAFRKSRGEIGELFTIYPDGDRARCMSFAVEMLIGKTVTDSLGVTADVSYTRLRYELEIESRAEDGFERLYVTREELGAITDDDDKWTKINIPSQRNRRRWIVRGRGRRAPYISTVEENGQGTIYKHQDGRSGRKQGTNVGRLERTVLSSVSSAEYPTAYAVRQEMLNWRFLQLDPVSLRTPSDIYSPTELLPDGSNLAAVLYRMSREDEAALTDVSRDMANLVPGILEISVKPISEREEFLIEAKAQDGTRFSSRVISDGTLRLLALVTLSNDPTHRGVLCFEEPENGVHPLRLERIVREVLKSLATDFEDDGDDDFPKQVLVNTHSPRLMSYVPIESLLYVDVKTRFQRHETRMVPVKGGFIEDEQQQYFTQDQVRRFMDSEPLVRKRAELESRL